MQRAAIMQSSSSSLNRQDFARTPTQTPEGTPPSSPREDGKVQVHTRRLAGDFKGLPSGAAASAPLATRAVESTGSYAPAPSPIQAAVHMIDEAHARLSAQVLASGGSSHFARSAGRRPEAPALDPDAPEVLRNLTVLRDQVHKALDLAEPGGITRPKAREALTRQIHDQSCLLDRAFKRWDRALPADYLAEGAFAGLGPASGAAGSRPAGAPLSWLQVHQASELLAAELPRMLKDRADYLAQSEVHHALYLPRMLDAKALFWDTAAATLDELLLNRPIDTRAVRALPPERGASPADLSTPVKATPGSLAGLASPTASAASPTSSASTSSASSAASLSRAAWGTASPSRASVLSASASPERALGVSPSRLDHSPDKSGASARARDGKGAALAPYLTPDLDRDPVAKAARPFAHVSGIFRERAGELHAQARDPQAKRLGEPSDVLGLGKSAGDLPGGGKGLVRDATLRGAFPEVAQMDERAFALACVKRAVQDAREATGQAGPTGSSPLAKVKRWWSERTSNKAVEKAFDRVYTQMLSRRPNEVVSTRVVVPIETQSGISQGRSVRQPLVLHCEQRPAIWVSDALHADYAADGVQGAHCHERTQHKHAVTLHVSKMTAADAQCSLTLVRHGVLSPNQLTRKGIKKLRDEDLHRVAGDLTRGDHLRLLKDTRLNSLQAEAAAGDPAATATRIRGERPPRGTQATPPAAGAGTAGSASGPRAEPARRDEPPLIDVVRRAASLNRAREAAQAAMAALPEEEIIRLVHQTERSQGAISRGQRSEPVTVRLTSVSLMTPDFWRTLGSYKGNERSMWRDQRQAWDDLEALKGIDMPMPALDNAGQLRRDAQGRLLMARVAGDDTQAQQVRQMQVKFEVAALNVPVNEQGTGGKGMEFVLRAHAETDADNRRAMQRLLGSTPQAWAACGPDQAPARVGGWLGDRLVSDGVSEREKTILRTLAAQIGTLYASKAHQSAGNDPYKLATRLIVLASRLGGPTATLINCKSGKDRTSAAETQARQMVIEIATTGMVPPLDAPATDTRSRQLGAIHASGGSTQVQARNTGLGGTKLGGEPLFNRFGVIGKDARSTFNGLSKYTHS